MTASLALNHRDPDLTAGDLRYLVRQLDARDVPDHEPVRVRRLPIGERLVVELRQITRTVARKQVAPAAEEGREDAPGEDRAQRINPHVTLDSGGFGMYRRRWSQGMPRSEGDDAPQPRPHTRRGPPP